MPKLVNRGAAGLLTKVAVNGNQLKHREYTPIPIEIPKAAINNIAEPLLPLAVDIKLLSFDQDNARLHPERNMEAICQSLELYGQLKPVVVQKSRMKVVAGNGTMEAATRLGWDKIAASIVEMTDAEAAGYGLADNRTAELARWDFEVVAKLDKLMLEAGHASVGWTMDELIVLRADIEEEDEDENSEGGSEYTDGEYADDSRINITDAAIVQFTESQFKSITESVELIRSVLGLPEMSQEEAITQVCVNWLESIRIHETVSTQVATAHEVRSHEVRSQE